MQNGRRYSAQIRLPLRDIAPGRYYTLCPKCSAERSTAAHRAGKGAWHHHRRPRRDVGCNHCNWTDGEYYNGRANGWGPQHDRFARRTTIPTPTGWCWHRRCAIRRAEPKNAGGGGQMERRLVSGTGGARLPLYRLLELNADLPPGQTIVVPKAKMRRRPAAPSNFSNVNPHGAPSQDRRRNGANGFQAVARRRHCHQSRPRRAGLRARRCHCGISVGVAKRVRVLSSRALAAVSEGGYVATGSGPGIRATSSRR